MTLLTPMPLLLLPFPLLRVVSCQRPTGLPHGRVRTAMHV